jgi:signal transduction histidine kinase
VAQLAPHKINQEGFKMKKFVSVFVSVCFLFLFFAGVFAQVAYADKAADAKAMVEKAATYLKSNGKEKAFAEFTNQKGLFIKGELYIFAIDSTGMVFAHGGNPKLVGKDMSALRDSDGKFFIKDMIEGAKTKGSGWSDYKWANPTTNKIEDKSTYFMKYNDVILGCGIYK